VVIRVGSSNVAMGKKILEDSKLNITSADYLADAAEKVVRATQVKL
jgi:succinyl-CoA synthetase beta subunit